MLTHFIQTGERHERRLLDPAPYTGFRDIPEAQSGSLQSVSQLHIAQSMPANTGVHAAELCECMCWYECIDSDEMGAAQGTPGADSLSPSEILAPRVRIVL